MIDREPDLTSARLAAAEQLADVHIASESEPSTGSSASTSAPTSSPSSSDSPATAGSDTPRAALAAARESLIRMGAMAVGGLSVSAAQRWGAHWVYSEQESLAVSESVLDVVEFYFGSFDHPLAKLGIVLGATAVPRMLGPKLPPLGQAPASVPAPTPAPEPAHEELKAAA